MAPGATQYGSDTLTCTWTSYAVPTRREEKRDVSLIEAAGLTKIYGKNGHCAVDSLTLTVPPGELFGFLGPNGAGKTTTIKLLVGLLTPSSGTACIGGHDLQTDAQAAKRLIGYVPDNPFLYDKLSGIEFLDFIGDLYSMEPGPARKNEIDRLLQLVDLTDRANKLIGSYSRGMRQKMALIAALLHRPKALFLDEPTVGLDPNSTRRLKDILRSLCAEQGTTVFLSTHTLEVAAEICDRVGIFNNGRLIALGSPAELTSNTSSGTLEEVFLELTASEEEGEIDPEGALI